MLNGMLFIGVITGGGGEEPAWGGDAFNLRHTEFSKHIHVERFGS